jgi:hypothetical protein
MKRLLCLSALIVYAFAWCPCARSKPSAPIAAPPTIPTNTPISIPATKMPVPTFNPVPTAYPTYTPYPTYTSYPTYTALPTDTSTPGLLPFFTP